MAMENGSLSASDVALLSRNDGCCCNNGFGFGNGGFEGLIYLAVIASMFGGGGWGNWGNRGDGFANAIGYQNLATQNDVQRGFDNQNSMSNQREILTAVTNGTAQTIAASTANASNAITAIKDGNAALIRELGNVETALTALSGQQRECCCDIKQLIQAASANTDAQPCRIVATMLSGADSPAATVAVRIHIIGCGRIGCFSEQITL